MIAQFDWTLISAFIIYSMKHVVDVQLHLLAASADKHKAELVFSGQSYCNIL